MEKLGIEESELLARGAIHTAGEIAQQPGLWSEVFTQIQSEKKQIKAFFDRYLPETDKIILTGAGTSSYIGMSLEGSFFRHLGKIAKHVPSTDLVTHPYKCFSGKERLMLISFARSGDSPESLAVVDFADRICKHVRHVIITCNKDGTLAGFDSKYEKLVITLPPKANDRSLAMTSSYTGMLLSGLLIARLDELDNLKGQIDLLTAYGRKIIEQESPSIKAFAKVNFSRAVFLGSGPLHGTACEGHLKLQEMTDGKIICKEDSYMGFRHGPKAVIDKDTILVYLFSSKACVRDYEEDLAQSIADDGLVYKKSFGISEYKLPKHTFDLPLNLSGNSNATVTLEEEFMPVCCIVPLQILAFYKSLALDYQPDNPSVSGSISRVVEGFTIYPLETDSLNEIQ